MYFTNILGCTRPIPRSGRFWVLAPVYCALGHTGAVTPASVDAGFVHIPTNAAPAVCVDHRDATAVPPYLTHYGM